MLDINEIKVGDVVVCNNHRNLYIRKYCEYTILKIDKVFNTICVVTRNQGEMWYHISNFDKHDNQTLFESKDKKMSKNNDTEFKKGDDVFVIHTDECTVKLSKVQSVSDNKTSYPVGVDFESYTQDGWEWCDKHGNRILKATEENLKALQIIFPHLDLKLPKKKTKEEKRQEVIEKLLSQGKIVTAKCWDDNESNFIYGVILQVRYEGIYPYVTYSNFYKHAYAVNANGKEITHVAD